MANQTLEELKAENEAEEKEATEVPQTEEAETEEAPAEDTTEEHDKSGETDDADTEGKAVEDWMKGDTDDDDDGSQPSKAGTFNDSDMAKARRKYSAKLEKKDDELEQLRREVEELKKPRQATKQLAEPKRDDFETDEDFQDARLDYRLAKHEADGEAKRESQSRQTQRQEQQRKTAQEVDQHYERAVVLANESGITPEMYQGADFRVRTMVNDLFDPKGSGNGIGDAIVDSLIASLGKGSEKVMYNLGVNKARLGELQQRFEEDPTGVKASIYLGQLNAELGSPRKKTTTAPKPAPQVNGDKVVPAETKALKKEYENADKRGDVQARFNARRKARQAGVDTSNW